MKDAHQEDLTSLRAKLRRKLGQCNPRLGLKEIPTDGNCQFNAICHQLRRLTGEEIIDYRRLRQAVVEELQSNAHKYENAHVDYFPTGNSSNYDEYCVKMKQVGCWGDNGSLKAAANVLGINIRVHHSDPNTQVTNIIPDDKVSSLYIDIAYAPRLHYDSTEPLDAASGGDADPQELEHLKSTLRKIPEQMDIDSSEYEASEDSEREKAVEKAVLGQRQKNPEAKGVKTSTMKGLLYGNVAAKHLDKDELSTESVYDVAVGDGDISSMYTQLRGGDGIWRLWPVIEKKGASPGLETINIISKKPTVRVNSGNNRRFKRDKHSRPELPQAAKEKRVPIKLKMLLLKGNEYGCTFPHTLRLLSGIEFTQSSKKNALKFAQDLEKQEKKPLAELQAVHSNFCKAVCRLFSRLDLPSSLNDADVGNMLYDYDTMISDLVKTGGEEDVEKSMDEADARRHRLVASESDLSSAKDYNEQWNSSFNSAVHEGGRRLLVEAFDENKPIEDCIAALFKNDEGRAKRLLQEFGADASELDISSSHLMGEALEILYCYLSKVRARVELRDYLTEQKEGVDSTSAAIYIKCEVVEVFMSSVPRGSPFYMDDTHRQSIVDALVENARIAAELNSVQEVGNEAKNLAKDIAGRLYDQAKKDRFFDVLVWLKDSDGKSHFQVAQCKARTNFKAFIDVSTYVGRKTALEKAGTERLGSLVRLDWVSNVFHCKQANPAPINTDKMDGDQYSMVATGHLELFLFEAMRGEAGNIFKAAKMAKKPFSKEPLAEPESKLPKLRPFQYKAVKDLKQARKDGYRGGSVIAATGSGKSITAFVDALEAMQELEKAGSNMPLVWTCPRIYLLMQSAIGFSQWETMHLRAKGEQQEPRYYYLVCSADDISTPVLRVISNAQVLSTMLRHRANGSLGCCRFFSTVEGSGGFWNEINKFIRVTRGVDHPLDDPVFNVFVRDEVHVQCGMSSGAYALGLNIPAKWYVSYTATSSAEKTNADTIFKVAAAHEDADNGVDPGDDSGSPQEDDTEDPVDEDDFYEGESTMETDADDDAAPPQPKRRRVANSSRLTKREKWMEHPKQDPEVVFGNYYNTNLSPELLSTNPAVVKATKEAGLKGLQLLSDNLQFVSLEYLAEQRDAGINGEREVADKILKVWKKKQSLIAVQEALKGYEMVVFNVEPELTRGCCTCGLVEEEEKVAGKLEHSKTCASLLCPNKESDQGEKLAEHPHLYRAMFEGGNFAVADFYRGDSKRKISADCLVLGLYQDGNGMETLCLRKGLARGISVHDSTEFGMFDPKNPEQKVTNLVGKALYIFTFAEAFTCEPPILAKPALAVYSLDPLALPLDGDGEDGSIMERIDSWLGISHETRKSKTDDNCMESGIVVKALNKVNLQISFGPGKIITATAHDYASVMLLLRLFERDDDAGGGGIRKAIAFCPNASACRRTMALFRAVVDRRIGEAKKAFNGELAAKLSTIGTGHVYQTQTRDGNILSEQPMYVRQQLIGEFLVSERYVLFNTNLLSTGVDFPCCDAVMLTSPTRDPRTLMQRWGRALRYVKSKPNKRGFLAMVTTDPYEPSNEVQEREKKLGISEETVFKNDQAKNDVVFDAMFRVAECAVHPSKRVIGVVFQLIGNWIRAAKSSGFEKDGEKKKQKSLAEILLMEKPSADVTFSLTPEYERMLSGVFKATTIFLVTMHLEEWLAVLGRWKKKNRTKRNPVRIEDDEVHDDDHGVVNLGTWLNNRKNEANGKGAGKKVSTKERSIKLMAEITTILELDDDPNWWKVAEKEDDGKPKPASVKEWLAVLERWKDKNPTTRNPADKKEFDDINHGVVNLGSWFSDRKSEANGKRGLKAAQKKSIELMPRITKILRLQNDPNWWKLVEKEDDGKPRPASVEEWLAVLGRWKDKNPTKRNPVGTEDDINHGVVNLGTWLNNRKGEANGKRGLKAAQKKSIELMPRITKILRLQNDPNWWKLVEKEDDGKPRPASMEEWLAVLGRWKKKNRTKRNPVRIEDDEVHDDDHGVVNLGTWLKNRKNEANGKGAGKKVSTKERSIKLMAEITTILELDDDPNWWKVAEKEDDGKPKPASVKEWLAVLERWKKKNRTTRTPDKKEFDDINHGVVNLGSWFSDRKSEANGKGKGKRVSTKERSIKLMAEITTILELDDDPNWWKVAEKVRRSS
ncbi:hypothetical protein Ndes2526B_g09352 [Nannochloris sp. 'desiccata']